MTILETLPPRRISLPTARRIALAAQGFLDPPPVAGKVSTRHLQRVINRVGVIQIDSVNVLSRSHYLPFFSRLGSYDRAKLDQLRDRHPRRLVEYWAHEASLIPPTTWSLMGFRMDRANHEAWGGMRGIQQEHPDLVQAVLTEVSERGPITARECKAALNVDIPRREGAGVGTGLPLRPPSSTFSGPGRSRVQDVMSSSNAPTFCQSFSICPGNQWIQTSLIASWCASPHGPTVLGPRGASETTSDLELQKPAAP